MSNISLKCGIKNPITSKLFGAIGIIYAKTIELFIYPFEKSIPRETLTEYNILKTNEILKIFNPAPKILSKIPKGVKSKIIFNALDNK
tara:strand:- start:159 stop:422 length:264 start_codon:yes stop_codon:yes gene_type:complete